MAGKNTAVFGIFKTREGVERAVDSLLASDFLNTTFRCFLRTTKHPEFAAEKNTKAPEGATTGAVAGGAIGGNIRSVLSGIGHS